MRLTPDQKGERTLTPLPDRLWNLSPRHGKTD